MLTESLVPLRFCKCRRREEREAQAREGGISTQDSNGLGKASDFMATRLAYDEVKMWHGRRITSSGAACTRRYRKLVAMKPVDCALGRLRVLVPAQSVRAHDQAGSAIDSIAEDKAQLKR
eukprot:656340-Pleurochrysis_carterae.AAC.2